MISFIVVFLGLVFLFIFLLDGDFRFFTKKLLQVIDHLLLDKSDLNPENSKTLNHFFFLGLFQYGLLQLAQQRGFLLSLDNHS